MAGDTGCLEASDAAGQAVSGSAPYRLKTSRDEDDEAEDPGIPRMTPEVLRDVCRKSSGYAAPELNDVLMLQYKGFRTIDRLSAYHNVKSLFLECNGIEQIQNLDALPQLISLYLQSNCISRIEGLESLVHLQYLNLSQNSISCIENLEGLVKLETIKLSCNKLVEVEQLRGLVHCRGSLKSVDVSSNYIEDGEAYMSFWTEAMPDLDCLYLHHNPCSRSLKDYRRRMVSGMPNLRWLDERPVTEVERVGAKAWVEGGKDAELKAKGAFWLSEQEAKDRSFNEFQKFGAAAAERANAQRQAEKERQHASAGAECVMQETGVLADGWVVLTSGDSHGHAPHRVKEERLEQQDALSAKVAAFLQKRRSAAPASAADVAPLAPATVVVAAAVAEVVQALDVVSVVPDEDDSPSAPSVEIVEEQAVVEEAGPFEWTAFRDRRLGRLVAECRYDFAKAAAALSKEFCCSVDVVECRRRYSECCKPRFAPPERAADREALAKALREKDLGRAKDAPEPTAEAVREVSAWWMRRLADGSFSAEAAAAAAARRTAPADGSAAGAEAGEAEAVASGMRSAEAVRAALGGDDCEAPREDSGWQWTDVGCVTDTHVEDPGMTLEPKVAPGDAAKQRQAPPNPGLFELD